MTGLLMSWALDQTSVKCLEAVGRVGQEAAGCLKGMHARWAHRV